MDKSEYIRQVLSRLPTLLEREKRAVEEELAAHFEDRMEPLLALHVREAEAERRCAEAMGDPVEIGDALAKQYQSFFWVVLKDILTGFLVFFLIGAVIRFSLTTDFFGSVAARVNPTAGDREATALAVAVDWRMTVGNDTVRLYEAQVRQGVFTGYLCVYDRMPGGVTVDLKKYLWAENQRGTRKGVSSPAVGWNYGAQYYKIHLPVDPEDDHVTLCCRLYGEETRMTIPLEEVRG